MSEKTASPRGKLFEFAVLHHPKQTEDQFKRGEFPKSVMIVEPTRVIAGSDKEVGILAARSLKEEYLSKLDEIEILVRPF